MPESVEARTARLRESERQRTIQRERLDAAQDEWVRHDRVNRLQSKCVTAFASEIRRLARGSGMMELATARDLERYADGLEEVASQLSGESWLRSPYQMQAERELVLRKSVDD